jgi:hypothetical protein
MNASAFRLFHARDWDGEEGYHLECGACSYCRGVPEHEWALGLAAVELFRKWVNDEMALSTYSQELRQLGFTTLFALDLEGSFWRCESCAEKVPLNFFQCWSCQAMRPHQEQCND